MTNYVSRGTLSNCSLTHSLVELQLWQAVPSFAITAKKVKGKGFPYSIPSVGHGADPGVLAVSPQRRESMVGKICERGRF